MLMHGQEHLYRKETPDQRYAAWCFYRTNQHQWVFFSISPCSNTGSGIICKDETDARQMVDDYMDRRVPQMIREAA